MSIVVTAATGNLGTLVVESLLARGVPGTDIVATGRSPEKLAELKAKGVRTAVFDYESPADGVLNSGDTLVLISSSEVGQRARQHQNVIDAAVKAGVARIVYTSLAKADSTSLVLGPEHVETEKALKNSGIAHTILRNGWYTENSLPVFEQVQQTGSILSSAAEGRTSSASRADYAEAAAIVASGEGHDNVTYELAGDESWTVDELASVFSQVLGRDITVNAVDAAGHREALQAAGLDAGFIEFLVGVDQGTAAGDLDVTATDLAKLLGRPTTPLAETVSTWRM